MTIQLPDRCSACRSPYLPIPMDGPVDADIYIFGERPGQQEQNSALSDLRRFKGLREGSHYCFIGDAGDEFNTNYLRLAGLDRDHVRVGNVVMCGAPHNKHPTDKEVQICSGYLRGELHTHEPRIVILQGGTSCSLLGIDFDLEAEHGIPRQAVVLGYDCVVVPMYHPAAGLHKTSMMIPLLEDWEKFGKWLKSGMKDWQWALDKFEGSRDYGILESTQDVDEYFNSTWDFTPTWCGCDTESHGQEFWSYQISRKPGTGRMVLAKNTEVLNYLSETMQDWIDSPDQMKLLFHHAPADLDITTHELQLSNFNYDDTMVMAYHLGCFLRLGLKILSRRVLGRIRYDWEHVVGGASRTELAVWMIEALSTVEDWRIVTPRYHKKTGKPIKPDIQIHDAEKRLNHLLRYVDSSTYEPWEKLREFGTDWLGQLVGEFREYPIKGIGNCSLGDAVYYGCSDADDTLSLAIELERMQREWIRKWDVQKGDVDV